MTAPGSSYRIEDVSSDGLDAGELELLELVLDVGTGLLVND